MSAQEEYFKDGRYVEDSTRTWNNRCPRLGLHFLTVQTASNVHVSHPHNTAPRQSPSVANISSYVASCPLPSLPSNSACLPNSLRFLPIAESCTALHFSSNSTHSTSPATPPPVGCRFPGARLGGLVVARETLEVTEASMVVGAMGRCEMFCSFGLACVLCVYWDDCWGGWLLQSWRGNLSLCWSGRVRCGGQLGFRL